MEPCTTPYPFYTPRRRATTSTSSSSPSTSTSRHPPVELNSPSDAYAEQQAQFDAHARRSPSSRDGGLLGCLYPGATFVGTQRSGQFAYEVTVTLATVSASPEAHLCGYLKIKGLTDEHPELTTYFDSELIMPGNENEMAATSEPAPSFRTPRTWGASEARDWQHWSRFPAFQNMGITDLDQRPSDDSLDGDSGAVFMRWKERFLVPDHRVKDINGASFAGFYYVCVQAPGASTTSSSSSAQARRSRRRSTQSTTFDPSSPIGTSPSTPSTTTTAVPDDDDEQPDATAHKSFSDPDGDAPVPDTTSLFGHTERHALPSTTNDVPSFVSSPNSLALGGSRSLHHEEDIYVPTSPSHHTLSPPDVHLAMPSASATPLHSDEPLPASSSSLPSPAPPQQHSSEPRPIPMPADLLAQPYSSYLSSSSSSSPAQHHEPEPEFDFDADVDAEDDDLPPPGTGALMYGYYFHPHSDPFQKLTLRHVPELDQPGSAFAFR